MNSYQYKFFIKLGPKEVRNFFQGVFYSFRRGQPLLITGSLVVLGLLTMAYSIARSPLGSQFLRQSLIGYILFFFGVLFAITVWNAYRSAFLWYGINDSGFWMIRRKANRKRVCEFSDIRSIEGISARRLRIEYGRDLGVASMATKLYLNIRCETPEQARELREFLQNRRAS